MYQSIDYVRYFLHAFSLVSFAVAVAVAVAVVVAAPSLLQSRQTRHSPRRFYWAVLREIASSTTLKTVLFCKGPFNFVVSE